MKNITFIKNCRRAGLIALTLLIVQTLARADIWTVDLSDPSLTLITLPNGTVIKYGGFSGLIPVPGNPNQFYTVTDRGPNADGPLVGGSRSKVYPVPDFAPSIIKLELLPTGTAQIVDILPIAKPDGTFVTGLPNQLCAPRAEPPLDLNGCTLPDDPEGLDSEAIAQDAEGNFWVCGEYRPEILMVSPDGVAQLRLVPQGTLCSGQDLAIPTLDILPSILKKRRINRGFEGITFAPNGSLYVVFQRPLSNPNRAAGDNSRNIRIVEINVAALLGGGPGRLVRQYVYLAEAPGDARRIADLFALSPAILLVPERRTDKLFAVNIQSATDITPLEDPNTGRIIGTTNTLEQLSPDQLAALKIRPAKKAVVVSSLTAIDPLLEKVEGVCVVGRTIVMTHDNDFNLQDEGDCANATWMECATPCQLFNRDPPNVPKVYTFPLPDEIVFPETD